MNILLTENIYMRPFLNEIKKQCALDYVKSITGEEFEFKITPTSQIKKEESEGEQSINKRIRIDGEEAIDLTSS